MSINIDAILNNGGIVEGNPNPFSTSTFPFISRISAFTFLPQSLPKFQINQTKTLEIEGSFFTPNMIVESEGLTVDNLQFINENKIILTATSLQETGEFDLKFNNGFETIVTSAILIENAPWVDLRHGSGETFEVGVDLVVSKDVIPITNVPQNNRPGMWFKNAKTWKSSAAFEKYRFVRGTNKTVEIIFNNYHKKYAIGIGKNPRNINASSQFYQAEVVLYFKNNHVFYGLYGDRNRQNLQRELDKDGWLKVKFTDDVTEGSKWYLYKLDSIEDTNWGDESNLIVSGEIDDRFKLEGEELFPFIIPQYDWNNYVTALRVF
ncbi:MAG: hypothetical protein QNJ54_16195 [Prochloraceae cyanobacterium]|nr:hypothetical protein [Prochloraceae cyanobacterium]